jgi:superfamily II DNA or RNA helicase
MEIEDFFGQYPDKNSKDFQYELGRLKEFNELELGDYEQKPSKKRDYSVNLDKHIVKNLQEKNIGLNFKQQLIIERFLSDQTDNTGLLVFHGLGTGKTRTSILASEINLGIKRGKTVVLAKNELIIENYKKELMTFSEMYIPSRGGKKLDPKNTNIYNRQLRKQTELNYEFDTFSKFSSDISKLIENHNEAKIIELYSNRVIVIDEAHNLRIKDNDTKSIYNVLHKFLHLVKNCKILLLTGTPVWDDVREIASLLNLILPDNDQLDYLNFDKTYFSDTVLKDNKISKYITGNVSYVKQKQSNVSIKYMENEIPNMYATSKMEKLKIYTDEMDKFQYDLVEKAKNSEVEKDDKGKNKGKIDDDDEELDIKKGKKGETKGLRLMEIEASNFTFPDGTYGTAGFKKNVKQINDKFVFKDSSVATEIKNNLKKYSTIFHSVIQDILNNPDELFFVYHPHVMSGGTVLFGLVLGLFGYSSYTGGKEENKKKYATISSGINDNNVMRIIDRFSSVDNKTNKYIHVLIGSKKISEGITLKNVKKVHIMVPHWNLSLIDQVIGRVIRYGSHPNGAQIMVYLHAAVYKNKDTVNIDMYSISEKKDLKARQVYRLMKKNAIDCPLTYNRNFNKFDISHSRECDYTDCNYTCNFMGGHSIQDMNKRDNIVDTNYNLFYSTEEVNNVIYMVKKIMKFNNSIHFNELYHIVSKCSESNVSKVILLLALNSIIKNKIVISDRYGFPKFMNENNNIYFLNSNIIDSNSSSTIPSDNLYLTLNMEIDDIIDFIKIRKDMQSIQENLCDQVEIDTSFIKKLDVKAKSILLETSLLKSKNAKVDKIINEINETIYEIKIKDLLLSFSRKIMDKITKNRQILLYVENYSNMIKFFSKSHVLHKDYIILFNNFIREFNNEQGSNKQKLKAIIQDLEKVVSRFKDETILVHTLFSVEQSDTKYKRVLKSNGLLRYIVKPENDGGVIDDSSANEWDFVSNQQVEEEIIEVINRQDKVKIPENIKNNKYKLYGTIDTDGVFRITDLTTKTLGYVCESVSDKNKIIKFLMRIILGFEDKDLKDIISRVEDAGLEFMEKETLKSNLAKNPNYVSLTDVEKNNITILRILYKLTNLEIKKLCSTIKEWLSMKKLLINI